jgi:hypothetical protein
MTFDVGESDDEYRRRRAYEHQLLVVADMTRYRLEDLDRRFRQEASDNPEQRARHAAVRDELQRRGYHVAPAP